MDQSGLGRRWCKNARELGLASELATLHAGAGLVAKSTSDQREQLPALVKC